jgi:hypothetical protein
MGWERARAALGICNLPRRAYKEGVAGFIGSTYNMTCVFQCSSSSNLFIRGANILADAALHNYFNWAHKSLSSRARRCPHKHFTQNCSQLHDLCVCASARWESERERASATYVFTYTLAHNRRARSVPRLRNSPCHSSRQQHQSQQQAPPAADDGRGLRRGGHCRVLWHLVLLCKQKGK